MNHLPLVSVVIPCYNHERFLEDVFWGLIMQEYKNIEVLICDDCSPDQSYKTIKSFEPKLKERFQRVEILRNENNLGVTKTLNKLIKISEGDFIKPIASDDAMTENAIARMVTFFQENENYDVVVSNGMRVKEEQHYPHLNSDDLIYKKRPNFEQKGFFERIAKNNEIFAPGAMYKHSVFDEFGLYDENIRVEDFEFWLRLLRTNKVRIGYIDEPLICYRINGQSMTSLSDNKDLERRRKVFWEAEYQVLQKYKSDMDTNIYADVLAHKMLNEYRFAVDKNLVEMKKMIEQQWASAHFSKKLSFRKYMFYELRYIKATRKKPTLHEGS